MDSPSAQDNVPIVSQITPFCGVVFLYIHKQEDKDTVVEVTDLKHFENET